MIKYLIITVCTLCMIVSCKANAGVTITKVDTITFVNITGKIVHDIRPYQPLLEVLYSAKKGDTVILNITTGGGSVDTGMAIVEALENTKAYTVANVPTGAYSMGAYITCYVDRLAIKHGAELMFHLGSVNINGRWTISALKTLVEESLEVSNKLDQQCKKAGIITDKDIDNINKGADVYITASTINKRLSKRRK